MTVRQSQWSGEGNPPVTFAEVQFEDAGVSEQQQVRRLLRRTANDLAFMNLRDYGEGRARLSIPQPQGAIPPGQQPAVR